MTTREQGSSYWVFGPAPDLLLGCGLLYVLIYAAYAFAGAELRAGEPALMMPLLLTLVSYSHYGGTLLRVYEHAADRRRYSIFSVFLTGVLMLCFTGGLRFPVVAIWLVSIYFTWSPWHYTGQNYGLALMFLRRRGVEVRPGTKRLLHTSFVLSFLVTFLALHVQPVESAPGDGLLFAYGASEVALRSLGLPRSFTDLALPAAAIGWALTLATAIGLLLREAKLRVLLPTLLLGLLQVPWFVAPYGVGYFYPDIGVDPLRPSSLVYYALWAALAHAAQYLWITSYYARASRGWHGYPNYFGKVLLAGVAIWTLPAILGSSTSFRHIELPGLFLLIAATVNLHHFVLDGAIWKLRSGPIADILIRSHDDSSLDAAEPGPAAAWTRRAIWAVCGGLVAAVALGGYHEQVLLPRALERTDYAEAGAVLDRMAWGGRDSVRLRLQLGQRLIADGERARGIEQYRAAVRAAPHSAEPHFRLGMIYLSEPTDLDRAIEHLGASARIDPEFKDAEFFLRRAREDRARRSGGGPDSRSVGRPRAP